MLDAAEFLSTDSDEQLDSESDSDDGLSFTTSGTDSAAWYRQSAWLMYYRQDRFWYGFPADGGTTIVTRLFHPVCLLQSIEIHVKHYYAMKGHKMKVGYGPTGWSPITLQVLDEYGWNEVEQLDEQQTQQYPALGCLITDGVFAVRCPCPYTVSLHANCCALPQ